MKLWQRMAFAALMIIATIAGGFWFLENYELKATEEYIGFQGEAAYNDLFAARLFLKRMGVMAERKDSLLKLPPTQTVLVLDTERYTLSQKKINELLEWVKAGGHLITRTRSSQSQGLFATNENDDKPKYDPLQAALAVHLGDTHLPDDNDLPIAIHLTNMPKPQQTLAIDPEFFTAIEFNHTDKAFSNAQQYQKAYWLLEKALGNGKVTLLSHLAPFENAAIHKHDHAEIFWYLIHSHYPHPNGVWLVHQDDMPPLWSLLWKQAWALVISLALFIPLTLMRYNKRFGSLLPTPAPARRRILEHIRASGMFMWRRYHQYHDSQYQSFVDKVNYWLQYKQPSSTAVKQHERH